MSLGVAHRSSKSKVRTTTVPERAKGIEPSFSAWEIENGYFGDLQESRKSLLRNYFELPLFTLRDRYFLFVVARIWHESINTNGTTGDAGEAISVGALGGNDTVPVG